MPGDYVTVSASRYPFANVMPGEEDQRIGLVVSVANWAGIPDRDRRALKSGQRKSAETFKELLKDP